MDMGLYNNEKLEALIKLLVEKGLISEAERKQLHEDIVARHIAPGGG